MADLTRIYGMIVRSEVPLPGLPTSDPPEVTVAWGEDGPREDPSPAAELLGDVALPGIDYSIHRERGYLMRYRGIADVAIDEALDNVTVHALSEASRELAAVLLAGNVLSVLLMLKGSCVLHASAVASRGAAICLVGAPGRGKSTLAALLCREGASLVTDDILRIRSGPPGFVCAPGAGELRLRSEAEPILEGWDLDGERSADGRLVIRPPRITADVPLEAVVFPRAQEGRTHAELETLHPAEAAVELTRFPRVMGWRDPGVLENSFRWNATIARGVPCYIAHIPKGPPLDRSKVSILLDLLEMNAQLHA